jgi:catechol 2,3-dioxygenase-like lactoylglutathione lyase family enzyme
MAGSDRSTVDAMTFRISHDHIGLSVPAAELEATIEWYGDKLGFTVARRFDLHGTTFVFLTAGDATIELMSGATDRQPPTEDVLTSMNPARLHHFALSVDNLDTATADLSTKGVSLIGGPMDVAPINQRLAFITDNLGNIIELTASTHR